MCRICTIIMYGLHKINVVVTLNFDCYNSYLVKKKLCAFSTVFIILMALYSYSYRSCLCEKIHEGQNDESAERTLMYYAPKNKI